MQVYLRFSDVQPNFLLVKQAKVGTKFGVFVASLSNISYLCSALMGYAFNFVSVKRCSNGGIGRHEGLKILWPVMAVRVQVPLRVQETSIKS